MHTYPEYFFSQCQQDLFVKYVLEKKTNGFFIDIGSSHPMIYNNSFLLESAYNWRGICVDKNSQHDYSYRKSNFLNQDAKTINYQQLFTDNNYPTVIDYLSIDTDEDSLNCFKSLPNTIFKYKVITLEHDYYRFGESLRTEERSILNGLGYHLLCSDVTYFEHRFEDWWINPEYIDVNKFNFLQCDGFNYTYIIENLRSYMPT